MATTLPSSGVVGFSAFDEDDEAGSAALAALPAPASRAALPRSRSRRPKLDLLGDTVPVDAPRLEVDSIEQVAPGGTPTTGAALGQSRRDQRVFDWGPGRPQHGSLPPCRVPLRLPSWILLVPRFSCLLAGLSSSRLRVGGRVCSRPLASTAFALTSPTSFWIWFVATHSGIRWGP